MDLHSRSVREDVRELGATLGDAMRAHESPAAYDAVEAAGTQNTG